jgi:hypothetical protein
LQVTNQTGETVGSITAAEAHAVAAAQAAQAGTGLGGEAKRKQASSSKGLGGAAAGTSPPPMLLSAALSKGNCRDKRLLPSLVDSTLVECLFSITPRNDPSWMTSAATHPVLWELQTHIARHIIDMKPRFLSQMASGDMAINICRAH